MSAPTLGPVSRKQVRELLADTSVKPDVDLSQRISSKVYQLKDGRMLVTISDGTGAVWPSRTALDNMVKDSEAHPTRHALHGRLTLGGEFATSIPRLLEQVRERLELPKDKFALDDATFKQIDRVYLKRVGRYNCFKPEHFEPLLAYVGEYLRSKLGGRWDMKQGSDQTWEPWLVFPNGTEYAPYPLLLRELERGQHPSIWTAVLFEVAKLQQEITKASAKAPG